MYTTLIRLGKYTLLERLGGKGRVEVWKAVDPQFRRYVAIQLFHADQQHDPAFLSRFQSEVEVIASLQHPNIVQIQDVQISHPPTSESIVAYLVTDYIEGPTLTYYVPGKLDEIKPLSPSEIVHLFSALASAIDYAHQRGVIHGDITPKHILLDKDITLHNSLGEPMLIGFGKTKVLGTSTSILSLWGLDMPLYLSPEQCQGYPGNEQSDIYALGVILYELSTRVPPFQGDSASAIMVQHIHDLPKAASLINPHISPALSAIILRCLEKNPKLRFPTAAALARALSDALLPGRISLEKPHNTSAEQGQIPLDHGFPPTTLPNITLPLRNEVAEIASSGSTSPQETSSNRDSYHPPRLQRMTTPDGTNDTTNLRSRPPHTPKVLRPGTSLSPSTTKLSRISAEVESHSSSSSSSEEAGTSAENSGTPTYADAHQAFLPPLPANKLMAQKRSGRFTPKSRVVIIVLITFSLLSGLGIYSALTFFHSTPVSSLPIVGHVYILSSWHLNGTTSQGINDEVQIELQNIPDPHLGQSYYAWLLGDTNLPEIPWTALGKVPVYQGKVDVLLSGDGQYSNLLADRSRFLITEDDANMTSNNPLLDNYKWRYYSVIPQTPTPTDANHFSMLDHLRHLLVQAPELSALGLPGGLSYWMLRNMEEITSWSIAARDHWNDIPFARQQLINILYYLDGECAPADITGVPARTPTKPANALFAHGAFFALLNPCMQEMQDQPIALQSVFQHTAHDYLDHILYHVNGVINAPGATPRIHAIAVQINNEINILKIWLGQLRSDALQLVHMTDAQFSQPAAFAVLSDMAQQARYAYSGDWDVATGDVSGGVSWLYENIQGLASFDMQPYKV